MVSAAKKPKAVQLPDYMLGSDKKPLHPRIADCLYWLTIEQNCPDEGCSGLKVRCRRCRQGYCLTIPTSELIAGAKTVR